MVAREDTAAKVAAPPALPASLSALDEDDTVSRISDRALRLSASLVVGDRQVLNEAFTPPKLLHRDAQIHELIQILKPAYQGHVPSHLLVYGVTGTGKTAVTTQVLKDIHRKAALTSASVDFIVINCKSADTDYAFLRAVVNALRPPTEKGLGEKLGTASALNHLRSALNQRGGLTLLCLDEVDRLVKKSGDNTLYSLLNLNGELKGAQIGIVGITNDLRFTEELDARVLSRLNEQKVMFPPYNAKQLEDILRERVRVALAKNALEDGVIEHIAQTAAKSSGDARKAIALLRFSVQIAEKQGAHKVTDKHVVRAKYEEEQSLIAECVRDLPLHEKLFLWTFFSLAKTRGTSVPINDVYESYKRLCGKLAIGAIMTLRSVQNYTAQSEALGLLSWHLVYRGRARGRGRELSPGVPEDPTLQALQESEPLIATAAAKAVGATSLDQFSTPEKGKGAS